MITITNFNKRCKIIFLFSLILLLSISGNVYATDTILAEPRISQEFLEWYNLDEKEKEETLMPSMYSVNMSEDLLEEEMNKTRILNYFKGNSRFLEKYNLLSSSLNERYNLKDYYTMDVEDQQHTQSCWAFALLTAMESNIQITDNQIIDLSERHMDYATSEDFTDGVNPYAFKRSVNTGGNSVIGLAYLTNGQGAVLEEDMPFENNSNPISLAEIEKEPNTYVTDYATLPSIYKYYTDDGDVKSYNSYGHIYTDEELKAVRNVIKEHIVKYGGITTTTASSKTQYYNSQNLVEATAYYCNDTTIDVDHAVTIVGWDDTYSKDNFTGAAKPAHDGAYIIQNSYSDNVFDDGYLYISYDDYFVEQALYGIVDTAEIDYDNLYQHNNFGDVVAFQLTDDQGEIAETIYYASIFSRNDVENEMLNAISLSCDEYYKFEIFINENGTDLNINNLQKVCETDYLAPGYHKIEFDPIELTGKEFGIVVKEVASNGPACLMTEPQVDGTFFEYVEPSGQSKISLDGVNWLDISVLGVNTGSGLRLDLTKGDVCIKAFTNIVEDPDEPVTPEDPDEPVTPEDPDEPVTPEDPDEPVTPEDPDEPVTPEDPDEPVTPEDPDEPITPEDPDEPVTPEKPDEPEEPKNSITSEKYEIVEDMYITKIYVNTTLSEVLKQVTITGDYKIYDKNDTEVSDLNSLVKTNMYLKLGDKKYYFAVRADLNGDGRISLIDLAKHVACYAELEGYVLQGAYLKACDLSFDGKLSLIDVSQFMVMYNTL